MCGPVTCSSFVVFLWGRPLWLVSPISGISALQRSPFCLRLPLSHLHALTHEGSLAGMWCYYTLAGPISSSQQSWCKPPSPINPLLRTQANLNIHEQQQLPFPHGQVSRLAWTPVVASSLCLCIVTRKVLDWVALTSRAALLLFLYEWKSSKCIYTLAFSVGGISHWRCFS